MSGIFGLFNQIDLAVKDDEIRQMASLMARRGPDRTGLWNDGSIGMGHTLLASTPEALSENLPLVHTASGCVITADARIDNRSELLKTLSLRHDFASIGDAELILAAYHAWDIACVDHLLGDFAFAIWDPRKHRLFCARDQFGIRPLYYHYKADHFFAFASEPRAILVLPQVPYQINEGRIADFLITQLEGIDKTSTFFEDVYRLPPAHMLTVTPEGMKKQRYWTLEPGPELKLSSNDEYTEAFRDVFTEAVHCRLRGGSTVGSMLSGGMDSGSIVAVARELRMQEGQGPLPTFSAISSDQDNCIETQTINAALTMDGLNPHIVDFGYLDKFQSNLKELVFNVTEPFDSHMTLVLAVYLSAHQQGVKALMDGIDGDLVLSEGSHIARLLRQGRWPTALRENFGLNRFWGEAHPFWVELYRSSRRAFVPDIIKQFYRNIQPSHSRNQLASNIRDSIICPDFAHRIRLSDRLDMLSAHSSLKLLPDLCEERALAIDHPYLTVGVERYNRVASSVALEPRHPFLDQRVVKFCMTLPGNQKLDQGWPKAILRRAMAGQLPDAVRWRRGKQHLGWAYNKTLMESMRCQIKLDMERNTELLVKYINMEKQRNICQTYFDGKDITQCESIYAIAQLGTWLNRHTNRPTLVT